MKKTPKDGKNKIGTAEQFLGLSAEESEYIKLKLALSEALAIHRKISKLTQVQLAKILPKPLPDLIDPTGRTFKSLPLD